MKWFYVIALAGSVALAILPVLWIYHLQPGKHFEPNQTVRYDSLPADIKSMDPATCGDVICSFVQANFFEGLYCYHYLLRPLTVIPQLAESLPEISPDGLTYTIKLKAGVKYTPNECFGKAPDGKPLTRTVKADDFVLAFKRVADYHLAPGLAWAFVSERIAGIDAYREKTRQYRLNDFARYDLSIEGVKAVDDLTLQIRLSHPFPQMLYILAMPVYAPIPREAVDYWLAPRNSVEFREAYQLVTTGPYILKEFKRKDHVKMVRNPDFREELYPSEGAPGDKEAGLLVDAGKRVPFVDGLWFDYVGEEYSAWMRFLTRQLDSTAIPKEVFQSVITPGKDLTDRLAKKGIKLIKAEKPDMFWLDFNMDDPVLGKSKSLRQAMCLCFDVESYIKVLHNGRGKRAVNIIPTSFPGHDEAGAGPYCRLDVTEARKKMEQAKAELAAAGLLVDGEVPTLTLDLESDDILAHDTAEFIQQQFAKIGLKVKAVFEDFSTLQEKVSNKQAQMWTAGWQADYPDAEDFLQNFYGPNIAKDTNSCNYSNPAFDKLYDEIRIMPESPARTAICARMAQMINEDCPMLLLIEPVGFVLFQDWLLNVKPHPVGYGFIKFQRIDTQLRDRMGGRR